MNEMCCATCDRFALEPGKRKSGVCFLHWIPDARNGKYFGAYGRVFPWDMCDNWIEQGAIERFTPYTIEDDQ